MEATRLGIALTPEILRLVPARQRADKPQVQKKPHRRRQPAHSIATIAARLPEEVSADPSLTSSVTVF